MVRSLARLSCVSSIAMTLSCTPVPPPGSSGSSGGELAGRCGGDFGASVTAKKLETFLSATADFTSAAAELEGSLISACEDMAKELEIPEEQLQGTPGEPKVKAVCMPVSAKIEAELQDLRASAKLDVKVAATPPRCQAKVDAYAECVGECEVDVDPGKLELQCEGGELRGECDAECRGTCAAEVEGRCDGTCEGTCSSKASKGRCDGECEGTCVTQAKAECKGECRGECSVTMKEPYCTGEVRAPRASADCQASCDARLNARAECTPGAVDVDVAGVAESNIPERAARVRAAIKSGLGGVLAVRAKLSRLGASGNAIVRTAGSLPNAVGELGVNAASCVTQAAAALPRATASVSVSVEVSASLSASAGAG